MGSWASTNFALSEMEIKGEEAYEEEYSDSLKILRIQAIFDLMEKAAIKYSESQGVKFEHPTSKEIDDIKSFIEATQ